jgi:hypothetical protein
MSTKDTKYTKRTKKIVLFLHEKDYSFSCLSLFRVFRGQVEARGQASERKSHLDFVMTQFWDRYGCHQGAAADDA